MPTDAFKHLGALVQLCVVLLTGRRTRYAASARLAAPPCVPRRIPSRGSFHPRPAALLTPCRSLGSTTNNTCSFQANGFSTLPPGIFSSLGKLTTLRMQCLPIQTLPADTFTPLVGLNSNFWCVVATSPH